MALSSHQRSGTETGPNLHFLEGEEGSRLNMAASLRVAAAATSSVGEELLKG